MFITAAIDELRTQLSQLRQQGKRIAFVPTMGNLHQGHLSLVRRAQAAADVTLVSIFVNPTQFAQGEDIERYPRTLAEDTALLLDFQVDMLFTPSVEMIYPYGLAQTTTVYVPELSEILCGAHRGGHFKGVTTVVNKLFNIVQPDIAIFGEKDFQQLFIIKQMVRDLFMPITILSGETCREADGLAMSSRNGYLTPTERQIAPLLYQTLQVIKQALALGNRDLSWLQTAAMLRLQAGGLRPDYVEIYDAHTLQPVTFDTKAAVILAAAYLGRARLIDNLVVEL